MSESEIVRNLHNHASLLIHRLFPDQESNSLCVFNLLKETIASGMLLQLIDYLSEPDNINQYICDLLELGDEFDCTVFKIRNLKIEKLKSSSLITCKIRIGQKKVTTNPFQDLHLSDTLIL